MGASLETEQRSKAEALRIKKKLEGDINELEIGLDHANKANAEGLKAIQRYQGQLRETIQTYEDEARQRDMEIADARNACNEMQAINGREMSAKRALDGHIHTVQAEIDAMLGAAKNAEEKSKKAMVDAARLADELRAEQ